MKHILEQNQQITSNSPQLTLLKQQFPQCFDQHGAFMPHKLQELVQASGLALSTEGYSLNWLGKSYARLLANLNVQTFLQANTAHNSKPEHQNSQNMLIKGDNLEVLKHLSAAYRESVKMIYIDPPYNTGSDGFVYQDDRKFTAAQLVQMTGIGEEEARRILEFTQSKSNSHSAWLTFMYPRLYVARRLLRDDGVIFISIDDNEQAQLKLLCDEVFGEENFVGQIIWKNVTDNNPTNVAIEHEYILVFSKNKTNIEQSWKSKLSAAKDLLLDIGAQLSERFKEKKDMQAKYSEWFRVNKWQLWPLENYKFIDENGVYSGERGVHNPGKEGYRYDIIHPVTKRPCKQPLLGYRFPQETMNRMIHEGRIIFGEDENKLVEIKVYAKDYEQKLSSVFNLDGRSGANELKELFPDVTKVFTNPKTIKLLADLFSFVCLADDLILDFFAGSGTTAHAVMQLNAEDNGNRRYICVQLDEATDPKSEAHKAGYHSIYDITAERIQRAAAKIRSERSSNQSNQLTLQEQPESPLDLGFQQFSTIPVFDGYLDPIDLNPQFNLFDPSNLSNQDRQNLMLTWQAADAIPLTQTLIPVPLGNYTAYLGTSVGGNRYLYALDVDLNLAAVVVLLERLDHDPAFSVNFLVALGYQLDSKAQREISEAIHHYQNHKGIELKFDIRF